MLLLLAGKGHSQESVVTLDCYDQTGSLSRVTTINFFNSIVTTQNMKVGGRFSYRAVIDSKHIVFGEKGVDRGASFESTHIIDRQTLAYRQVEIMNSLPMGEYTMQCRKRQAVESQI